MDKVETIKENTVNIQDNCFDLVRLFCALSIFLGHFITHYDVNSSILHSVAYFVRGVPVFFCLSGFFISRSVERYGVKEFYARRFLKIYPSMWVCIIMNTVIILLVYNTKPTPREFLIYLLTQFSVCQFFTGAWLRGYGVGAPNGALWTITVNVQFYLLAYLLIKWLQGRPAKDWKILILGGGIIKRACGTTSAGFARDNV